MLEYYKNKLGYNEIPEFLKKYLNSPSLLRLKFITYFCGMDYASPDLYDFKEFITRYDHSITTALITWKLTHSKIETLAALFHDISTPCFSHVIDYMNKDYEKQESTEKYTKKIMESDKYLLKCLKQDNIELEEIINFKKYSIVDNERPKLCADRLDGIILTGYSWINDLSLEEIGKIIDDLTIYKNEINEEEIGFKSNNVALKVVDIADKINLYCHSPEDNYMMEYLANITKVMIDKKYISYNNLFILKEEDIFNIIKKKKDKELIEKLDVFKTILWSDIENNKSNMRVKKRDLNPLVKGYRLKRV